MSRYFNCQAQAQALVQVQVLQSIPKSNKFSKKGKQRDTVPQRKTGRSCLIGYYALYNSTRIKGQGCFGILLSLAFQWVLKLCD